MPPGREDDAASGIFTYDGSFTSSAQNTQVPGDASLADASFAAKVAAESEKVAAEFDLPLGVYGFGGGAPSTNGSYRTEDVMSTYSGVFDLDESSFLRGVSADAAFEAQERAEELERSRSTPPGSKGEDTKMSSGVGECIGDYDVPAKTSSESGASNASEEKGILDGLVRTMVSMGLAWGTVKRPSTPETIDKTSTPTGSEEAAPAPGDLSVSVLSFDGPEGKANEVNSTTSGSKAPFFKSGAVTRSYKERLAAYNSRNYPERNVADSGETKPPLLNPTRLITICSCVVLFAVALAVGGWIAISRRGEENQASKALGSTFDDDEVIRGALTDSPTETLTVSPETTEPVPEDPCGEDSISALFEINNDLYDCIWFSERTLPYQKVMCEKRRDIADACRQTCSGKCGPTAAPTMQLDETSEPTVAPTVVDTEVPTGGPTLEPSLGPTFLPTLGPTGLPTSTPSARLQTGVPTAAATLTPTGTFPVASPTFQPTRVATTGAPFAAPTRAPIAAPTQAPFSSPTRAPVQTRPPVPVQTRPPVPVQTGAPTSLTLVCPPDNPGYIPGSTTTCEQFRLFHPDFVAQRCQPGWPVYTFCYATCNSCFYV